MFCSRYLIWDRISSVVRLLIVIIPPFKKVMIHRQTVIRSLFSISNNNLKWIQTTRLPFKSMQRYNKKHVIQHIFDKLFHYSIAGTYIYKSYRPLYRLILGVILWNGQGLSWLLFAGSITFILFADRKNWDKDRKIIFHDSEIGYICRQVNKPFTTAWSILIRSSILSLAGWHLTRLSFSCQH